MRCLQIAVVASQLLASGALKFKTAGCSHDAENQVTAEQVAAAAENVAAPVAIAHENGGEDHEKAKNSTLRFRTLGLGIPILLTVIMAILAVCGVCLRLCVCTNDNSTCRTALDSALDNQPEGPLEFFSCGLRLGPTILLAGILAAGLATIAGRIFISSEDGAMKSVIAIVAFFLFTFAFKQFVEIPACCDFCSTAPEEKFAGKSALSALFQTTIYIWLVKKCGGLSLDKFQHEVEARVQNVEASVQNMV